MRWHNKLLIAGLGASLILAVGCDDDSETEGTGGAAADMGMGGAGGAGGMGGEGGGMAPELADGPAIEAFLTGKTLTMTGDDIPEWPLGFFEGANFGAATQCYNSVAIAFDGTTFTTSSDLGTLVDAPTEGDVGTCDRDTVSNSISFPTTGYNITGTGECFDVRFEYNGFTQVGRARVTADAVEMELYFVDQATGATCADGAVGSEGVQVNGADLGGDSVQVYRISE